MDMTMPGILDRTHEFETQQSLTLFNKEKMRDRHMMSKPLNARGFTLIEMMIAMAAGLVVLIGIYSAYQNHQRSHVTQQLVVDMQQNARAAMALMKREIRMAGYDPAATDGIDNEDPDDGALDCADPLNINPDEVCEDADESANDNPPGVPIGFVTAEDNRIQFTADHSYNDLTTDPNNYTPNLSGANENLTYQLVGTTLQRNGQPVAYDIEALGFAYAYDADNDGELDRYDPNDPNSAVIWAVDSNLGDDLLDHHLDANEDGIIEEADGEGGIPMPQVSINLIKAVRIWLLARTRQPIKDHTDNNTYVVGPIHRGPADGDWDPSRKRVLLTTTIYCRNMGS
jgi:type IV pilus assembly protein PilW